MNWFDVLKVLPKDVAMEDLEQRYGLKFTKRPSSVRGKKKVEYVLEGNGIKIKLTQTGVGFEQIVVYIDNVEEGRPKRFKEPIALSKKLEMVKAYIDANYTKKSAGAVTTATPAITNIRYSPKEEDEE